MTEHDLSFIQNYAKIRHRLYHQGSEPAKRVEQTKLLFKRHRAPWRVTVDKVAREYLVTPEEIIGRSKDPRVKAARKDAATRLFESGMSLNRIGKAFDNRGHSTIHTLIRGRVYYTKRPARPRHPSHVIHAICALKGVQPASAIARSWGITRNAVIGIWHRNGMSVPLTWGGKA